MKAPRELNGPEGYQVQLLVTWGRVDEARALIDAYSKFDRAFGGGGYVLPEPITGPMEGLEWCPASGAPTRIVDVEIKDAGDGWFKAVAA